MQSRIDEQIVQFKAYLPKSEAKDFDDLVQKFDAKSRGHLIGMITKLLKDAEFKPASFTLPETAQN